MTKFIQRLIVYFLVFVFLAYLFLYLFINLKGKEFVHGRLSRVFDQPVYIEDINLIVPFSLIIEGVKVADVLQADFIRLDLRALLLSGKTMVFHSVVMNKPVLKIYKTAPVAATAGAEPQAAVLPGQTALPPEQKGLERTKLNVLIEDLKIQQGEIIYKREPPEEGRVNELVVKNLTLYASNVPYPLSPAKTGFDLSGQVESPQIPFPDCIVKAAGWANLAAKSMDAQAVILQPSGQEGLSVDVKAENNDMTVRGKVSLAMLGEKYKDKQEEDYSLGDYILGALENSGVEVSMDFAFDTKMDDFRVDKLSFSGNILYKEGQGKPEGALGSMSPPIPSQQPGEEAVK